MADEADPRAHRHEREQVETEETEWAVAHERGGIGGVRVIGDYLDLSRYDITQCESEQAARDRATSAGGKVVFRKIYHLSWR